ncbi:MAG TPA: formylglycine-generating enzyme family protein [Candidatus Hydrogenedentes bacterium]|nr:formylglycine-generating enzyme family protein [Candidatus Hydrogenedentota bacterium]
MAGLCCVGASAAEARASALPGAEESFAGLTFVWAPPGAFRMGSKLEPKDIAMVYGGRAALFEDEAPRHEVRLNHGFWVSVTETTNAQFEEFVRETGYKTQAELDGHGRIRTGGVWEDREGATWRTPGWDIQPNQPVVLVSWNDAQAYLEWLTAKGIGRFRLPTEAEWEYACRAGGSGSYSYGDDVKQLKAYACFRQDGQDGNPTRPLAVGSRQPNILGLLDIHGNVSEWCADWYGVDYYNHPPENDPAGPATGELRVIRGGSWCSPACYCRSAARTGARPGHRYSIVGFRIVRDGPE